MLTANNRRKVNDMKSFLLNTSPYIYGYSDCVLSKQFSSTGCWNQQWWRLHHTLSTSASNSFVQCQRRRHKRTASCQVVFELARDPARLPGDWPWQFNRYEQHDAQFKLACTDISQLRARTPVSLRHHVTQPYHYRLGRTDVQGVLTWKEAQLIGQSASYRWGSHLVHLFLSVYPTHCNEPESRKNTSAKSQLGPAKVKSMFKLSLAPVDPVPYMLIWQENVF